MKEQLTMNQIAESLGLSRNAVSAVINNRARKFGMSEATEARIRDYIEHSGYVQAKHALQMKNGVRDNTVELLYCGELPQHSHVLEALTLFGHEIEEQYGLVEITGITPARVKDGIREQVAKGVDRLIWIYNKAAHLEIQNAKMLLPLLERIKHVVIYNFFTGNEDGEIKVWEQEFLRRGIHLVGFDRRPAYRRTAEMLWRNGHRRIALNEAFFADPTRIMPFTEQLRKIFVDQGFELFGLHPDSGLGANPKKLSPEMALNLAELHRKKKVNCAFIRNDNMAIEVIFQLMALGIRVPEDIAIVGYGGSPLAGMLPVQLTTFHPPVEQMCAKTLELVNAPPDIPGEKWYYEDDLVAGRTHGDAESVIKNHKNEIKN